MILLATLYDWLMVVHVLAAMLWVGGLATAGAFGLMAARATDPAMLGAVVSSLRRIGPLLFGLPAGVLVLFGVLMVLDSSEWGFGQTWIRAAVVLLVASAALGATLARGAIEAAGGALAAGDSAGAARLVARWSRVIGLILALLVLATCDMIIKPGL
jgi:hypothetical protein